MASLELGGGSSAGGGLDAERPAERPQHPPHLRYGGDQRGHLRIGHPVLSRDNDRHRRTRTHGI